MAIDISIVVPFFNAEKYIHRCIRALVSQDYPSGRYEIIMVDNNSRDRSAQIARRFPSLKLIHEPKQGAYAARNRGIAESRGAIVAFTDPDCEASPVWLENIAQAMAPAGVRAVVGYRAPARRTPLLAILAAYQKASDAHAFNSGIEALYYGATNNMAVRSSIFDTLGRFDEIPRGSDTIFVRRITRAFSHRAVIYRPDVRVRHMELDSVAVNLKKMFIYGRSRLVSAGVDGHPRQSDWEKLKTAHRIIRRRNGSTRQAALLYLLVSLNYAFWQFGQISAFFFPGPSTPLER